MRYCNHNGSCMADRQFVLVARLIQTIFGDCPLMTRLLVFLFGLSLLIGSSIQCTAQPVFSKSGAGTFNMATMQGLRVGLGNDSYQTLQPFLCPPAGQAPTILSVVCIGSQAVAGEEYLHSLSFNVTTSAADAAKVAAGQSIDKVASYLGVQAFEGAAPADVWARNTTVWAAPGFVGGIAGEELDLNNSECDACGNHSFFGYWLTGGGSYPNRAGIFITGANANNAYQWHFGIQCVAEVKDACLFDDTSNDGSLPETDFIRSTGHHSGVGVNLENSTFDGGAIGIVADQRIWLDSPNYAVSIYGDTSSGFTVSAPLMTVQNKIAYGTSNSYGNHEDTAQTVSSYGTGTSIMTPSSLAESATNNIGVVNTGGVLIKGDVACQDGTNMASWTVSGMFLMSGTTLTHIGTDVITQADSSSATASKWTVQLGVDTVNLAPTISTTIGSGTAATCTGRIDAITVR